MRIVMDRERASSYIQEQGSVSTFAAFIQHPPGGHSQRNEMKKKRYKRHMDWKGSGIAVWRQYIYIQRKPFRICKKAIKTE